nr:unnamed protein product [Callosobruchus chinensis]
MSGEGGDEDWLNSWEQQCSDAMEEQPNYEQSLISECSNSHSKIWSSFQESASAVAQLYRDKYMADPGSIWLQFQTAAGTITSLYRESCEGLKRTNELAKQSGYQKRNSELFNWAKRKRRLIRREDLLAYLAGKHPPPPPRQSHHHPHHRLSPRPRTHSPPASAVDHHHHHLAHHHQNTPADLLEFSQALVASPLCAFIAGEMARHGSKRPASPALHDVHMDSSPQGHQKRPRYM